MNIHTCNEEHTIMAGATNILQKMHLAITMKDQISGLGGTKDKLVNGKM